MSWDEKVVLTLPCRRCFCPSGRRQETKQIQADWSKIIFGIQAWYRVSLTEATLTRAVIQSRAQQSLSPVPMKRLLGIPSIPRRGR